MGNGEDKNSPTKVVEVDDSGTPVTTTTTTETTILMGDTANMSPEELAAFEAEMNAIGNQGAADGGPAEAGSAGNQASDLDRIEEIQEQTKLVDENQHVPGDPPRSNYSTSDRTGLSTSDINALYNQDGMVYGFGYFGQPSLEPKPTFAALPSETIYDSQVNAQIVIGPYKPVGVLSPGIIRGETRNATIDLVAGRLGAYAASVTKDNAKVEELRNNLASGQVDLARVIDKLAFEPGAPNRAQLQARRAELESRYFQNRQKLADLLSSLSEERVYCNNSYKLDAARVTICQRGDVDEHFGIRPGAVGTARGSSFVALKADDIRLIARQGIKIITGTDDETSQAGSAANPRGIDLIAGNDDEDVQPMVKGSNLVECLQDIVRDISDVNGSLVDFFTQQMAYNSAIAFHTHISPAGPTLPSLELLPVWVPGAMQGMCVTFPSLLIEKYNYMAVELKYLTPKPLFKPGGANKFILSRGNRTN